MTMAENDQKCLKKLETLRKNVNWKIDKDRRKLLRQLYPQIRNWKGQLPNLRDIFQGEEIDWILIESVLSVKARRYKKDLAPLIDFVISTGYKDEPKLGPDGQPLLHRTTALHHAASRWRINTIALVNKLLEIYNRFDVNYVDNEGITHFHLACKFGGYEAAQQFLEFGQDPNCLVPKTGDSPLHLALMILRRNTVVELLLIYGANPNLANESGLTSLHVFCSNKDDDVDYMNNFFKINDELNQRVLVDARDKEGRTPLHLALSRGHQNMVESLLRRGTDPNLADENGLTPLHYTCNSYADENLMEMLFDISDELNQLVQVDARDEIGNTPLQLALKHDKKKAIETLLRRGANPNSVNEYGSTPLHIICQNSWNDNLMKIFFEIIDELEQPVEVDAKDKSGQTPLQLAVANLMPSAVGVLLDHGADLSSFVFLPEKYLDEKFEVESKVWLRRQVILTSGVLGVVEHLEKRGYKLDQSDALTIMKLFSKCGLFEKSVSNVDKRWHDDEEFMTRAKRVMVKADLSLYDLIQLRPEEATKLLTYEDYFKYANFWGSWERPIYQCDEACYTLSNEKIYRTFIRRWAVEFFWQLTSYRLPILCCEMIIKQLRNEDLGCICLAFVA